MNGRWGRRIYGSVKRINEYDTEFMLQMVTRDDQVIGGKIYVATAELEEFPYIYGATLDQMVEEIDKVIKSNKNTP